MHKYIPFFYKNYCFLVNTLMKTAIFFNSHSGGFRPEYIYQISDLIYKKYGKLPEIYTFNSLLKSNKDLDLVYNYDTVFVAGGDGTLKVFAEKLINSEINMGIIPTGTANVLARELSIPLDPLKAVELLLKGKSEKIDVGIANKRLFLSMVSCGIDAKAVKDVNPKAKEIIGSAAYVIEGIGSLITYKPSKVKITIDNQVIETKAYVVVIANTKKYGTGVDLATNADITYGILDVCIFQKPVLENFGFLLSVAKTVSGLQIEDKNIIYKKGKNIIVEADPPAATQVDGDKFDYTPLHIDCINRALKVLIP